MKTLTNLSLLSLALIASSCNEKISPELLQANATAPTNNNNDNIIQPQSSYSFAIKNASPTMLGFQLHKTGYGNASKNCEINSTLKFGTQLFQNDKSTYDITCFYEAEELSMFFNGFSFNVESSPNSCEYVGYQPFGFYDKIPGRSSGTYSKVVCTNNTTTNSHVAAELRNQYLINSSPDINGNYDYSSGNQKSGFQSMFSVANEPIKCDEYMSTDSNLRTPFTAEKDEDLCRFNYTDAQCDIGKITINEMQVTYTPATGSEPASTKVVYTTRQVSCGGKISNCVQGPVKTVSSNLKDPVNVIELSSVTANTTHSKNYSYSALYSNANSLKQYANYRRNLANKDIDFVDSTGGAQNATYFDAFIPGDIGETIQHQFQPEVMELYAINRRQDKITPLLSTIELSQYAIDRYEPYSATPYAADPYLGLYGYNVNPFYTFYCFDKALDVKARIRMVVREWDRVFPATGNELELLSDIWDPDSKQDSSIEDETTDETYGVFKYNDIYDWDDHIPMMRTEGDLSLNNTIWMPAGTIDPVTGLYSGWFNPNYFTDGEY